MWRPIRRSLAAGLAIALVASGCSSSSRPPSQPSSAPTRPHVGFMVVEKSGVTQASDGAGGYGVVIANPTTRDALWVSLYIHLLDARSHVVGTQVQNLILMPADNTYDIGGSFASATDPVTRVSVSGIIRKSIPYRYALPSVSQVRVVKGPGDSEQVVGSVANIVGATLSRDDPVGVVFFGPHGKVIGGTAGIIGRAVTDSDMETFHVPISRLPDLRSVGVTVGDVIARAHRHPQTQADSA